MCGRYTLTTDMKKVTDRFGAPPSYNIAPTQAMIVLGDDDKRHMKQMRWGGFLVRSQLRRLAIPTVQRCLNR